MLTGRNRSQKGLVENWGFFRYWKIKGKIYGSFRRSILMRNLLKWQASSVTLQKQIRVAQDWNKIELWQPLRTLQMVRLYLEEKNLKLSKTSLSL